MTRLVRSYGSRRMRGRAGFSLVEVMITVVVVGVLATIALPHLRKAAYKADAAATVSDAQTVRMAALSYFAEQAEFPESADWGSVPPELVDLLPDGFEFSYEGDVDYRWRRTSTGIRFGTGHMGQFQVRHNGRWGLADAMRGHQGNLITWTPAQTTFLFPQ